MLQEQIKTRLDTLRGTLRKACVLDGAGRTVIAAVSGVTAAILLDDFFFR